MKLYYFSNYKYRYVYYSLHHEKKVLASPSEGDRASVQFIYHDLDRFLLFYLFDKSTQVCAITSLTSEKRDFLRETRKGETSEPQIVH